MGVIREFEGIGAVHSQASRGRYEDFSALACALNGYPWHRTDCQQAVVLVKGDIVEPGHRKGRAIAEAGSYGGQLEKLEVP